VASRKTEKQALYYVEDRGWRTIRGAEESRILLRGMGSLMCHCVIVGVVEKAPQSDGENAGEVLVQEKKKETLKTYYSKKRRDGLNRRGDKHYDSVTAGERTRSKGVSKKARNSPKTYVRRYDFESAPR